MHGNALELFGCHSCAFVIAAGAAVLKLVADGPKVERFLQFHGGFLSRLMTS
jgi:hypothetical protein